MNTVIIDIRTKKEFTDGSYPGAINIPSGKFEPSKFEQYKNDNIALVCYSGQRAKRVREQLNSAGFSNVTLMQSQIAHISDDSIVNNNLWSLDRQLRFALGLLIGIFFIGQFVFQSPYIIGLLVVMFTGLIYSAITDKCYLKMMIAAMPWNKAYNQNENVDFVPERVHA